jgi:hypothetical protein
VDTSQGNRTLAALLLDKIREQLERTQHLLGRVPSERLQWRPEAPGRPLLRLAEVQGHLLECLAGCCAVLYALHPERLAHFQQLRDRPVNHACSVEEAVGRLPEYLKHIEEGFALLTDQDLGRGVPTVFVPEGEAALTLLLGNLEHLINHKHQLFCYLRLLGVEVATTDLYRLRGL